MLLFDHNIYLILSYLSYIVDKIESDKHIQDDAGNEWGDNPHATNKMVGDADEQDKQISNDVVKEDTTNGMFVLLTLFMSGF